MNTRAQLLSLQDHVWQRAGWRKHLVGRAGVATATLYAIEQWPQDELAGAADAQDQLQDLVVGRMSAHAGRQEQYGFIWAAILSAVVAQIIRVLLEWWLESRDNRKTMTYLRIHQGGLQ